MANTLIATGVVNSAANPAETPKNWAGATWRATPTPPPGGVAIFTDGSRVPASYSGQLDFNGDFNGALIGNTALMLPPGTSLTFEIDPVASSPPQVIEDVRTFAGMPQTLGSLLSARIHPLRIQAAAQVFAYSAEQVINPVQGSGYVNTTDNTQWSFEGTGAVGQWVQVSAATPGATYPPPGIPVSTGSAWTGSIDPATIPRLAAANIFTAAQTINANLILNGRLSASALDAILSGSASIAAGKSQIRTAAPNMLLNPPGAGGGVYLAWDQGTDGTWFGNGAGASVGHFTGLGDLIVNRNFFVRGFINVGPSGSPTAAINTDGTIQATNHTRTVSGDGTVAQVGVANSTSFYEAFGQNTATNGQFRFRTERSDGSNFIDALVIDGAGNAAFAGIMSAVQGSINTLGVGLPGIQSQGPITAGPFSAGQGVNIGADGHTGACGMNLGAGSSDLYIVAATGGRVIFNNYNASGAVEFYNGAGISTIQFSPGGDAHFNGTVSAGTKTFVIPHPLDPVRRELVHACLEGPEHGVFYRGESKTIHGLAIVDLPDYFEALTRSEGRTIQLTQAIEDGEQVVFSQLAAGRIKGGKFAVYSAAPAVAFAWEVKAIRADVPQLVIERDVQVPA